jgi:Antibiotic biosynthesis monooxygenase
MANDTESKVLEVVVFTLRDGASRGDFLATEAAMDAWLHEQPGFQSYDLLLGDDGDTWAFIGWWRTMADARAAGNAAMTAPGTAPMLALIDFHSDRYRYLHAEPANV